MTDAEVSEPSWPTHCPVCGTELRSEVLDAAVTNEWNEGAPMAMLARDFCPNPECTAFDDDVPVPDETG